MKKYVTIVTGYDVRTEITEVEVDRESDSSVWIGGRRRAKVSDWDIFHDTWESAHARLMEAAEAKVEQARRTLERHKSNLGNVKGMKKPE